MELDIELDIKSVEEFLEALLNTYRSRQALSSMVLFEFEKNLEEITTGNNLREIAGSLINEWAIPTGELANLIVGAYKRTPKNPKLKKFVQKLSKTDSKFKKRLSELGLDIGDQAAKNPPTIGEANGVDLRELVGKYEASFKQGLVAIALDINSQTMFRYLRERLEKISDRLGSPKILADPLLISALNDVNAAKNKVERLKGQSIIFSVLVTEEEAFKSFWQYLCNEFQGETQNCFMLIISIEPKLKLPSSITRLPPPEVTISDINDWLEPMFGERTWPLDRVRECTQLMLEAWQAYQADIKAQTDTMYDCIDDVINLFKSVATFHEFHQKLKQRSEYYVKQASP